MFLYGPCWFNSQQRRVTPLPFSYLGMLFIYELGYKKPGFTSNDDLSCLVQPGGGNGGGGQYGRVPVRLLDRGGAAGRIYALMLTLSQRKSTFRDVT